ncbi:hypothetical protein C8Q77DRAFT_427977 [Trametes polyzona]|nr:hypothetical protein C8Q77DRAFT_427977 [Trametes polyzona]
MWTESLKRRSQRHKLPTSFSTRSHERGSRKAQHMHIYALKSPQCTPYMKIPRIHTYTPAAHARWWSSASTVSRQIKIEHPTSLRICIYVAYSIAAAYMVGTRRYTRTRARSSWRTTSRATTVRRAAAPGSKQRSSTPTSPDPLSQKRSPRSARGVVYGLRLEVAAEPVPSNDDGDSCGAGPSRLSPTVHDFPRPTVVCVPATAREKDVKA